MRPTFAATEMNKLDEFKFKRNANICFGSIQLVNHFGLFSLSRLFLLLIFLIFPLMFVFFSFSLFISISTSIFISISISASICISISTSIYISISASIRISIFNSFLLYLLFISFYILCFIFPIFLPWIINIKSYEIMNYGNHGDLNEYWESVNSNTPFSVYLLLPDIFYPFLSSIYYQE